MSYIRGIAGQLDDGTSQALSSTPEGHLEVAIHDPLTTFGEVSVEQGNPVFQTDFIYGINAQQCLTVVTGSGGANGTNQMLVLNTGTTINSYAVAESRRRLRYRPGTGVKVKFTAIYTTPVANSYQVVGCGTAENGIYFGYGDTNNLSDTSFGILYVRGGKREVKTLTLTTRATSAGNVTVTLNGTAFTVALTNTTLQQNVFELATATYAGWDAYPNGATVVYIRKLAGTTAGTQTFGAGATGSAASIAQTRAGSASTDTFIKQSDWNVDKLDGTGASDFTINPQKINLFRFKIGFLGAHDLVCQVKITPPGSNNSVWQTVHVIKYANLNTQVSFTNSAFPFNAFAYSAGSTTDLTVKVGSFAGVIEGKKFIIGARASLVNTSTGVGAASYLPLISILNPRYYNSVANQVVINITTFTGAIKHTSPVIYYIIKNGTLTGPVNFAAYSSTTATLWDTAATGVTFADNAQLLYTFHLGDTGEVDHYFTNGELNGEDFTVQPGEWVTVAARSVTGTPSYVTAAINIREDQ